MKKQETAFTNAYKQLIPQAEHLIKVLTMKTDGMVDDMRQATSRETSLAYNEAEEFISKTYKYSSAKLTAILAITDYLLYQQGLKRS